MGEGLLKLIVGYWFFKDVFRLRIENLSWIMALIEKLYIIGPSM